MHHHSKRIAHLLPEQRSGLEPAAFEYFSSIIADTLDWKILASELISSLLSDILKLKGTRYCGHLKDYGILGNVGIMLSGRGLCPTDTLNGSTACLTNVCSKVNVEHVVLFYFFYFF